MPSGPSLIIALALLAGFAQASIDKNRIWNETWTDKLKKDLFHKYDKFSRPAQHYNLTTIEFGIQILHVTLDELKSTVTVNGWAFLTWTDEKLKWNSSEYGDLEEIHVGNHEVWQPDVLLYNSGTANTIEHYGDAPCIVYSSGKVLWVPPARFVSLCEFDLTHWPFDTQRCSLKFGSWTFHGEQVDVRLRLDDSVHDYIQTNNSEWRLINVTKWREETYYSCCVHAYSNVNFLITLKRSSQIYYSILLVPAIAVACFTLVTFWLSPWSELKITMAGCTTLTICVFLVYFGMKIPVTPNPPLIVYFYSGCLCQVAISLVISVLVINACRRPYCKPLPRGIRLLLTSWPGKLLGLSDHIAAIDSQKPAAGQILREKLSEDFSTNSTSNITEDCSRQVFPNPKSIAQLEWIMAAIALDRISFIVFSLALGILGIICLS